MYMYLAIFKESKRFVIRRTLYSFATMYITFIADLLVNYLCIMYILRKM